MNGQIRGSQDASYPTSCGFEQVLKEIAQRSRRASKPESEVQPPQKKFRAGRISDKRHAEIIKAHCDKNLKALEGDLAEALIKDVKWLATDKVAGDNDDLNVYIDRVWTAIPC